MTISLTIDPLDDEDEVRATVLPANTVRLICQQHGLSHWDLWRERPTGWREPVTLGELRDWLGY